MPEIPLQLTREVDLSATACGNTLLCTLATAWVTQNVVPLSEVCVEPFAYNLQEQIERGEVVSGSDYKLDLKSGPCGQHTVPDPHMSGITDFLFFYPKPIYILYDNDIFLL